MTRGEIQSFFLSRVVNFGGTTYAVPTLDWLQGAFYAFFRTRLYNEDLESWTVKWECRDFVRAFAVYAQECNALTPGTPGAADALAVGEFWFHPDGNAPGADHAVNACFTDKGLVYIDPQSGLTWPMSPAELRSCAFLRF